MPNNSQNASSRSRRRKQHKLITSKMASVSLMPKPRSNNFTRLPKQLNNKIVELSFRSQSYLLRMNATLLPAGGTGQYYRNYFRFGVNQNETISVNPILDLANNTTTNLIQLGIFGDTELASWAALYSNVKLISVLVKYKPSITMGLITSSVGSSLAANAVMYHCPILENIDDIITTASPVLAIAATGNALSHVKQRPRVAETSIYRSWSRRFVPAFF